MKQWTTLMDGIENLQLEDVPEPTGLKDNEVLVKIHSVSLNYRDTQLINGGYKATYKTLSERIVAASDASGTVVEIGSGVTEWREGDRVFGVLRPSHLSGPTLMAHNADGIGIPKPGVLAELRIFPASGLVAVPDYMTFDEASTLPIASITAWMSLNWDRAIGNPRRGPDTVVLLQGTGGVSIATLQQAKALGLRVIITSSSDAKLERARLLGADHTINYKTTQDWSAEVVRLTNGRGADVVLETGGPATMNQSIASVASGGNISAVGVLSGLAETEQRQDGKPQLALSMSLIRCNATLKGINVGPRDRLEEMLEAVYKPRQIHPVIDRTFGFGEAKEALKYMNDGSHFGKVVIKVQ